MVDMKKAIIAGSIGLDIIPIFGENTAKDVKNILAQGKFTDMQGTRLYLGGCVGNTGIAMHKLGVPVTLVSKVGNDLIGSVIRMILAQQNVQIAIETVDDCPSSSTVVVAPPGADRILLHSRGASQTFRSGDLDEGMLSASDLLHFAYPTAMKHLYANVGEEFIKLLQRAKKSGITISIDMSQPDPNSEPGRVDWKTVLKKALPYIDLFMPSLEELLFMLHRDLFDKFTQMSNGADLIDVVDFDMIPALAQELLDMGASVVLLKLGKKGLYLRTASLEKLQSIGRAVPDNIEQWVNRELLCMPYQPKCIRSTTGAGDNAIAGFLAGFLRSDEPAYALNIATANALRCIESYETTDCTVPVTELDTFIASAPAKLKAEGLSTAYWQDMAGQNAYQGSLDQLRSLE